MIQRSSCYILFTSAFSSRNFLYTFFCWEHAENILMQKQLYSTAINNWLLNKMNENIHLIQISRRRYKELNPVINIINPVCFWPILRVHHKKLMVDGGWNYMVS